MTLCLSYVEFGCRSGLFLISSGSGGEGESRSRLPRELTRSMHPIRQWLSTSRTYASACCKRKVMLYMRSIFFLDSRYFVVGNRCAKGVGKLSRSSSPCLMFASHLAVRYNYGKKSYRNDLDLGFGFGRSHQSPSVLFVRLVLCRSTGARGVSVGKSSRTRTARWRGT